jgi:hypothetical protein
MKKILQTVVVACAWCKSVVGFKNHEVECDKHVIVSHGLCKGCDTDMKNEKRKELNKLLK